MAMHPSPTEVALIKYTKDANNLYVPSLLAMQVWNGICFAIHSVGVV